MQVDPNEYAWMKEHAERMVREIATLRAQLEEATRRAERFAKAIVREPKPRCDHACAQCVPGGPIVRDGFACAYHEAVATLDPRGGAK